MPKPIKIEQVKEIQDKFSSSRMTIFTDYCGLTVAQLTDLRKQLRNFGVEYKVYKNTLVKIAANNLKYSGLNEILKGPTAIAFSEEPIAPSKVVAKFAKEIEALGIKGAIYNGEFIDDKGVVKFATLLSRDEAITKLAVMLNSLVGGLARVIDAVRKKKEEESSPAKGLDAAASTAESKTEEKAVEENPSAAEASTEQK